ncbi:hypothetical protein TNCV_376731 [Trichonephila clavipes]|nr:hypothetical protein TNCV_376731 [Trichonephila clavipes]
MVKISVELRFRIPFNNLKMPRHRIRVHYEQLSEFKRGRIIGLKEKIGQIGESLVIWVQEWVDSGRFQSHDSR